VTLGDGPEIVDPGGRQLTHDVRVGGGEHGLLLGSTVRADTAMIGL
jgi:hypothetical protein